MALLQMSLIWAAYAVVIAVLFVVAAVFIYVYQTPRDRSPSVTLTCIIAIGFLLATTLLLPVDVALLSATVSTTLGQRKEWATPEVVDKIIFSLTLVYYILYSVDILLCLLVIPFVYFWYEEYDEVAAEEGDQNFGQRLCGASKYTLSFVAILVILFLVGFFVPVSRLGNGNDLDFFKRLLTENRGERALTFAIGLLTTIGMCVLVVHTSTGLAVLPVRLIKGASSVTIQSLKADLALQLESNRERQRQLEGRCGGNNAHLSSKDRRELDALMREERTLIRRQRLAEQAKGEAQNFLMRAWHTLQAFFRPFKLFGGVLLLLAILLTWVSMLLTAIDKAKNSTCKHQCGYILGRIHIFNPINQILVLSARVFPVDYVFFALLVLIFFIGSVVGIATVGIRFLWINIFQVRRGHTPPQALLLMTAMLMLSILALNYTIAMVAAPQYATFGPQTFCNRSPDSSGRLPGCGETTHLVKPCSEAIGNEAAQGVCTPSVASTLLNRLTIHFPFFGVIFFWAQFGFLGIYLIALVISVLRSSKVDEGQLDEDAENAEEEALLASNRRRANSQWQDAVDRASRRGDV
ncbi:hypothetical protein BJX64DRAFT_272244 [Aspergillus heterothallicus]